MPVTALRIWGLMIAFSGCIGGALAQEVVRPAKVEKVVEETIARSWNFPDIVLPSQEVSLGFRVSGQIIELPVRAAVQVEEGEVIAQLDPRDFELRVRQLESQRDQAQAQLDALRSGAREEEVRALEASLESARAQTEQARAETERTRQLVERNVASAVMLEQAETQLRVAESGVLAQEEKLAIALAGGRAEEIAAAEAGLRGLESQLDSALGSLSDVVLKAPFDGIVARRSVNNFSLVQAGQEIVLLHNIATLHLSFDIPANEVPAIVREVENLTISVVFSGSEEEYVAELVEFSTQADAATQTYQGRVAVAAPRDIRILPGMVGRVIGRTGGPSEPMIKISLSAVGADPDGSRFVWIVDSNGTVNKRFVEIGSITGNQIIILSGLEIGETIIAAGVSRLRNGMTIRPITLVGS